MNKRLQKTVNEVRAAGLPIKEIYESTDPEVEDDAIYITDGIHLQVSEGYDYPWLHIERDGIFKTYPERRSVAEYVTWILQEMESE